jgi:DNA recombination protein RmuC
MEIILLIVGLVAGIAIGYLLANRKASVTLQAEKELFSRLDKEFTTLKATSEAQLNASRQALQEKINDLELLKSDFQRLQEEANGLNRQLATVTAQNKALLDKLDTQKTEIEELGKKFTTEFENLANRILDTKTQKFTDLNKTNLSAILEPLGKNIEEFKKTVNEVYNTEAKERFSLGEQVKALADLNKTIGEEARNLTKALKGEAKTQGRWGEMILETILEKSGLRKGEEYFMEAQLTDENGNPLRSDSEGKKMRPDAVISYPDNRKVIIDSKVSLNAFTRFIEATEPEDQKKALNEHLSAIKNHIIALSTKGYDDYDKALDFVMMFIPSEPAYIAALQGDPEIWNFAYDRRILLLSPTNLITSLKLIVDLWKREQHNQNAKDIAERGAKMYDKLVGFVDNLEDIGKYLEKANSSYNESYKQLKDGKDNLILQATKMKDLGIKNKKFLPDKLVSDATLNELSE